jgi:hypothetical protein
MLWKCLEKQYHEDGFEPHRSEFVQKKFEGVSSLPILDNNWQRIVTRYNQTQATYETDKLPALSGLVKAIRNESRDEYMAGLWRRSLQDDLGWSAIRETIRRPEKYRAPS